MRRGCALGAVAVSPEGDAVVYPARRPAPTVIIAVYRRKAAGGYFAAARTGSHLLLGFDLRSRARQARRSARWWSRRQQASCWSTQLEQTRFGLGTTAPPADTGDVTRPTSATDHGVANGVARQLRRRRGHLTRAEPRDRGRRRPHPGRLDAVADDARTDRVDRRARGRSADCFGYPGNSFAGCALTPGASCCMTFYQVATVAATPDGKKATSERQRSAPTIMLQPSPVALAHPRAAALHQRDGGGQGARTQQRHRDEGIDARRAAATSTRAATARLGVRRSTGARVLERQRRPARIPRSTGSRSTARTPTATR